MAVKFTHQHTHGSLYVPGDIAAFDAKVEKDLVEKQKVAEKYTKSAEPAAPAA